MTMSTEIAAHQRKMDAKITESMDKLADDLAKQLEREFGDMLSANDESWHKVAVGIINGLGLKVQGWIDYNDIPYMKTNFPVANERLPLFSVKGLT